MKTLLIVKRKIKKMQRKKKSDKEVPQEFDKKIRKALEFDPNKPHYTKSSSGKPTKKKTK